MAGFRFQRQEVATARGFVRNYHTKYIIAIIEYYEEN